MEIEAAVLPVKFRTKKLCNQYAIRTLTFAKTHPIQKAMRQQRQLCFPTQLSKLVRRIQEPFNVEEISIQLAKLWSKPASACATFIISTNSNSETVDLHKQWLRSLVDKLRAPILLYTDGSKMGNEWLQDTVKTLYKADTSGQRTSVWERG
jgi:hypothetical protein